MPAMTSDVALGPSLCHGVVVHVTRPRPRGRIPRPQFFMQYTDADPEQQRLGEFVTDPADAESDRADDLAERNRSDIEHLRELLESTVEQLTRLTENMEHTETDPATSTEQYTTADDDIRGFQ